MIKIKSWDKIIITIEEGVHEQIKRERCEYYRKEYWRREGDIIILKSYEKKGRGVGIGGND